ncbi:MAG: hypothetical protein U0169_10915 [Polyangiaceae bacterium]
MNSTKTPAQLVDRALILGVLAFRSRFEGARLVGGANFDSDMAAAMASGVTDWLRDAGVGEALVAEERALLAQPALTWTRNVVVVLQAAGLEESLGAILFALGALDRLPSYDSPTDHEHVVRILPFLSDSPFVTREGMAPREEYMSMRNGVTPIARARIEEEERRAGLWFWRARSRSLVSAGHLERAELEVILAQGASASRALTIPVDERGEFLAEGTRYADLDDRRFARCSMIAEARLRALRWTLSDASWTDVDMST